MVARHVEGIAVPHRGSSDEADERRPGRWIALGAVAVHLVLVLRTAWVTDDAFITLRTVDNWVNGYGLRWNADERGQAYTHPLWMFALSAAYAIPSGPFYTTIGVSA